MGFDSLNYGTQKEPSGFYLGIPEITQWVLFGFALGFVWVAKNNPRWLMVNGLWLLLYQGVKFNIYNSKGNLN